MVHLTQEMWGQQLARVLAMASCYAAAMVVQPRPCQGTVGWWLAWTLVMASCYAAATLVQSRLAWVLATRVGL
jgi:hypothetical protein